MKDTPLTDGQGVLLKMYDADHFSRDVIDSFAELRSTLVESAGLLHVQMGVLAVAVRAATASGDSALPLRICSFLNDALMHQRVVPELENAVAISFVSVEELRATVLGRSILERMPARVQQILVQQEYRDKAH